MTPNCSPIVIEPFKGLNSAIGKASLYGPLCLDTANTWTVDDGNTNLKRIAKSGIHSMNIGLSNLAGNYFATCASAATVGSDELAAPYAWTAAAVLTYSTSLALDNAESWVFGRLGIK